MKNILLFLIITIQTSYCQENYSDLKELGLNGNVKTIFKNTYSSDSTEFISKEAAYFNKKGNLIKIIDSLYENGELKVYLKDYLESNNGVNTMFKIKENGEVVEYGSYEWLDDKSYKIKSYGIDAIKTEYYYYLNQKLRDSIGKTEYYLYDPKDYSTVEYLGREEHQKFYDRNGVLKRIKHHNSIENEIWEEIYKVLGTDKNGNSLKVQTFDKESDSLIAIKTYQYIYY